MCLAVPLRITAIDGEMATVEMGGVTRHVSLVLTPEARAGDYVLVHTGFAINVLNEQEARETLALFAEMEEASAGLEEDALDGAGAAPFGGAPEPKDSR